MCLALFVAADRPLPIIQRREYSEEAMLSLTWPREAQRFHTAVLRQEQEAVQSHFAYPNVLCVGSYEGCGCGFTFGREYPDFENDVEHLAAARESVAELVRYIQDSHVREIYSCWFGDEAKPKVYQRTVMPELLAAQDFFFREQELLQIVYNCR
jgi:hypothetical protein